MIESFVSSKALVRSIPAGAEDQLAEELRRFRVDDRLNEQIMAVATPVRLVIESIGAATAASLRQQMQQLGGEAIIGAPAGRPAAAGQSCCLLAGTKRQVEKLLAGLEGPADPALQQVGHDMRLTLARLSSNPPSLTIGPLTC